VTESPSDLPHADPKPVRAPRRRVGLSIATKIFLGFSVVIFAFGAASAFTLYRMSELRQTVTVLWKELTPMSNQLRGLSRQLKSAEEFVALKRPNDAQWLQQVLPALEPFEGSNGFLNLAERLDALSVSDALAAPDRAELATIAEGFRGFANGPALTELLAGEDLPDVLVPAASSAVVFDRLVTRTLKSATSGALTPTSPEARATSRTLRRLNREVNDAVRALAGPIRAIDLRTEENERTSRLFSVAMAGAALVISVVMLVIALFTLRPLRTLGAGVRRIAAGDYQERVKIASSDEIGQLAEEFNRMASSLEERDKALAEKQRELVVAERLAAVGRLAAQITHEVRNPLSSISLNTELLEEELETLAPNTVDTAETKAAREMLSAISSEVQRLKDITEQYLQLTRFSRPPTAQLAPLPRPALNPPPELSETLDTLPTLSAPERVPCDLSALISSFTTFLKPEADLAAVRLEVLPAPQIPAVLADPDQLRQALLNVAKNALDSLRGSPEPRAICFSIASGPASVVIRIEDNGPGLPEEIRRHLFTPFLTSKPHGTGLGLAVTRDIMKAHGGDVRIESPLGPQGGTAVSLLLPKG
jgi:two-component system NtrC family sensor kinase